MIDNDMIVLSAEVGVSDIAYNLQAQGIDEVLAFIKQMDTFAADSDFTDKLYKGVKEIWDEMNRELISADENPMPDYQQPPVNLILNITGDSKGLQKEIIKTIKELGLE